MKHSRTSMADSNMCMAHRLVFVFVLLTFVLHLDFAFAGSPMMTSQGQGTLLQLDDYPRYRLRPGDVLDFNFTFTPEFNQTVTVQPDGYINLRGAGDLHVQDKTTREVVEAVRKAYGKILRDPVVTAELKQFEKPYFIIGGEVVRPGKYDLGGATTLTEAISIAGGFNDRSKSSEILVFRRVSDAWAEVKRVDLKQMLKTGDLSEDVHLSAGDMILVPKSRMSKIAKFIPIPTLSMYFNPLAR